MRDPVRIRSRVRSKDISVWKGPKRLCCGVQSPKTNISGSANRSMSPINICKCHQQRKENHVGVKETYQHDSSSQHSSLGSPLCHDGGDAYFQTYELKSLLSPRSWRHHRPQLACRRHPSRLLSSRFPGRTLLCCRWLMNVTQNLPSHSG